MRYSLYIDGEWRTASSGATLKSLSPIDDAELGTVPAGTPVDVDEAVAATQSVANQLRDQTVSERTDAIEDALNRLRDASDEIAETIAREVGKPLSEARAEVAGGIESGKEYCHDAARLFGDVTNSLHRDRLTFTRREPYGPTGIVTPWNYPFEIPLGHLCAALAVGNPVVWNPASETSLSAAHVARAFSESPLPDGAFNFVTGRGSTVGSAIVEHPAIRFVAFTGGTDVGQYIASTVAERSAECLLELGGNDPVLILDDADVDAAAESVVFGSNYNCGQCCSGTERVIATDMVYDDLVNAVATRTATLAVGDPLEDATDVGPPINADVRETIAAHVEDAVANGATLETGGEVGGRYCEPTVLSDVDPSMRVAREETFGPVTPILRAESIVDAVDIANDSRFGLQAAVFTESIDSAHRAINALEAGGVVVNGTNNQWEHHLPFGGVKESGSGGRFKGSWHLEAMTQLKAVAIDYDG